MPGNLPKFDLSPNMYRIQCYDCPVKKLLVIFLLVLLPIQFCWAVAAAYCQHEQGTTTHFGHHEHKHEAAQSDDDGSQNSLGTVQAHADCVSCHGTMAAITLIALPLQPYVPAVIADDFNVVTIKTISPDRPERPKWALAV